jgi:hypothetical protein
MKRISIYSTLAGLCLTTLSSIGQTVTDQPSTANVQEFKPSGVVSGQVFGDYFLKVHADSALRGSTQYAGKTYPNKYNAFALRRLYLGYDYQFSEKFASQLILANENDNADASGERAIYIKALNLKWKNFIKNNDLIFGQTATPFFALVSDNIWGYRSVEKGMTDMRGFAKANDFGISLQGKLNDKGDYGYNLMVANGGKGGQYPEVDKYKKGYGELYAKLNDQKIIIDLVGAYEPTSIVAKQSSVSSKLTLGYTTKMITIGVDLAMQTLANAATDTTLGKKNAKQVNVSPFGFSLYVRGQIIENKLQYFARYDSYNPNSSYSTNIKYSTVMNTNKEQFITVGCDWTPTKNIHFMPNIWYNSYSTLNNNLKGTLAKNDYDFVSRVTIFYKF